MNLSQKQYDSIQEAEAALNIWEGSVRAGKSYAALWAFLHYLVKGPPGLACIVGRTMRTIETNVIDQMANIPQFAPHLKYLRDKELVLFNRKIKVISANDASAEMKIRGGTYAMALVDEITVIPESAFMMLLGRLSVKGARLFGTTNPDSPYHWLKRNFLDRKDELDLRSWSFRIEDNPELDPAFVERIKKEYTGLWYQRFIEGKWVQAEGAIYDQFDPSIHVIDFPKQQAKYYIVGIDYGTSNAFAAVLIGFNPDSYPHLWVEDEYYYDSIKAQRQKTDIEYVEDMVSFLKWRNVKAIYVDPSALSFRLEMNRHGVPNVLEAQNEVEDGIRLVSRFLTEGRLKFCMKAKNTIAQMQSYVWDPKGLKIGIERPLKENDHCADGLRYGLFTHFFGHSDTELSPQELERIYMEAHGMTPNLPRFFQQPGGIY